VQVRGGFVTRASPPRAILPAMVDRERPNVVVPIGGWTFPAPPDWRVTDEARHLRQLAQGAISPDDLTARGMPRCQRRAQITGIRCANEAVPGSTLCRIHGGVDPATLHPDDPRTEGSSAKDRAERIDRVRMYLELAATSAVAAIQAVVESDDSRPQDRLKAAEIILDRTVGRQIQMEREDAEERDLDAEILAAAASVVPLTGTES
jgi:hypothetical protein